MTAGLNQEIGQRYLLRERLGEGAHGTVYRAWDSVRKGEVALKLFKDEALDVQTAEAARQFEVADGSAILPLLEVHPEFAEGQVTVMPLMPGTLADARPLFVSAAVHVTRRVLTGLEFCHGRGVVHGDVKPGNIFVDRNSVLLGDFGVAGVTLEYAAPEQLRPHEKSVATDLWAAAVSFYELLCGELPFGDQVQLAPTALAARIAACSYAHPDDLLPSLPLRFRRFFRDCFIADPAARRYGSAAEMRAALTGMAVRVEWTRVRRADRVVCFEGYELTPDGVRNGTVYEASVVTRRKGTLFVPQIRRAPPGGQLRRMRGLPQDSMSKAQAGQRLSVWMRTLTESGRL